MYKDYNDDIIIDYLIENKMGQYILTPAQVHSLDVECRKRGIRVYKEDKWEEARKDFKTFRNPTLGLASVRGKLYKNTCKTCGAQTVRESKCKRCYDKVVKERLTNLINIGLCQQKFYKPTVWKYAKDVMVRGYAYDYVVGCDMGRGKGKYMLVGGTSVEKIVEVLCTDLEACDLAIKYDRYKAKIER